MGLDQYAYLAAREGQYREFWEKAQYNSSSDTYTHPAGVTEPEEFATWRKHPNLQGWMSRLYYARGGQGVFNCVELELTWDDLDRLGHDIESGAMAQLGTTGVFFGDPSDKYYRSRDLAFVQRAKAEVFIGRRVFYTSSW